MRKKKFKASKESATQAIVSFERIVSRVDVVSALILADIRSVRQFLSAAQTKLPSMAAYDRERGR